MPCRAVPKPAPLAGCRAVGAGLDARPGFPCRRNRGTAGEKGDAARPGRAASAARPAFPPARLNPLFKRRRPSMFASISSTARPPAARAVAARDACPFCGGKRIKREPPPDRLGEVGIPAVGGYRTTTKPGEECPKRRGCAAEFVHAESDIKTMTDGLLVMYNIPAQIKHHCKRQIKVPYLLTRHRAATMLGANAKRSPPAASVAAKKELIICFMCGGARTLGTPIRRIDPERRARCAFAEMGME